MKWEIETIDFATCKNYTSELERQGWFAMLILFIYIYPRINLTVIDLDSPYTDTYKQ